MATEIERKFLLKDDSWMQSVHDKDEIRQAYLSNKGPASVRVRIFGKQANINIKSRTIGISRAEYEYPIPLIDAEAIMLSLCGDRQISKTRHYLRFAGHLWEIDVFSGDNQGLTVAEIELEREDEKFTKPDWLGAEVTSEERYYNVALLETPYTSWT